MFHKKRLFVVIPTLVLIPLILAVTPLKLVNKFSHVAPFAQGQTKQGCNYKNCFSQSLISHNYFDSAIVDAKSSDPETSYLLKVLTCIPETFNFDIHNTSIPLRC